LLARAISLTFIIPVALSIAAISKVSPSLPISFSTSVISLSTAIISSGVSVFGSLTTLTPAFTTALISSAPNGVSKPFTLTTVSVGFLFFFF